MFFFIWYDDDVMAFARKYKNLGTGTNEKMGIGQL